MSNRGASFLFSEYGDPKGELKYYNDVKNSGRSPEEKKRILADMKAAGKKYGFTFREYTLYGFERLSPEEQHAFVSDCERIDICRALNTPESIRVFGDKYETYRLFSESFGRELVLIGPGEKEKLISFINSHNGFIAKSPGDFGGFGVKVYSPEACKSAEAVAEEVFGSFSGSFVVEELLENVPALKALHPASLNTIRIPTVRFANRVEVVHPFLRIGRGACVVDNASSGGIMGAVDPATGVVFAAADEDGNFYSVHPDTGVPIVGFRIPCWAEAVSLAKKLATVIDGQKYCGWDIAPTTRGCVLVEANAGGMFVWQIPEQKGFRPELEQILKELSEENG